MAIANNLNPEPRPLNPESQTPDRVGPNSRHIKTWFALSGAALLVCVGCTKPPPPAMSQADHGLIWMLPGIQGGPATLCWAHAALRDAGVKSAIHVFDWERPGRPLDNLRDYDGNLAKAAQIAANIADYRKSHPTQPIDVIGYSGGGGLAILVAEALPPKLRLRNIILAQPALSPDYDLSRAMSHVSGKLVNFYCPTDWLVLGLGTRTFGTTDRKETESSGKVRFSIGRDCPYADKVEQRGWDLGWLGAGHFGDHLGILSYGWNRKYVAPYVATCESG